MMKNAVSNVNLIKVDLVKLQKIRSLRNNKQKNAQIQI